MTPEELDLIQWRATRGSYYEGGFQAYSLYAKEVVERDVPRLIAEYRRLAQKYSQAMATLELVTDMAEPIDDDDNEALEAAVKLLNEWRTKEP